ncbi:MAG: sensor histidine kinase N-terminal domain-containing protein [Pseudomonadota bacterium]
MTEDWSLRRRLIGWLLLATAALGIIALADTWREARRTAQDVSDRVLLGSAMAIAERVVLDEQGSLAVDLPWSSLEMLSSTAQDRVFYRVDQSPGAFLTGYADLPSARPGADGRAVIDAEFSGARIRVATISREVSTGAGEIGFTVTVAETTLSRDALARSILLRSAIRLMAMILGAAASVWMAVTVALRPLDQLGAAISQRSPADLRPVRADTPTEVRGLLDAVNSFMARLDAALAALRNFTGNAGHQLRTPLSVVRTQLALARGSALAPDSREAVDKADAALTRAERVLAQLLALARVDAEASAQSFGTIDVADLTRGTVAEMIPAATGRDIDLGYEGVQTAAVLAEPVLFQELLRNLLDNALAHAGPGARVTARVTAQVIGGRQRTCLEVEDDGPGLSAAQLDRLAAHVRSAQPRRMGVPGQDGSGFGLGLPIVIEIAALFGAGLEFTCPDSGRGLLARVRFAPAPGASGHDVRPASPGPGGRT